jgi:protein-S-isoprenylcysteine O-methyltransferase Ste14
MMVDEGQPDKAAVRNEPIIYLIASLIAAFLLDRFVYPLTFRPRWIGGLFVIAGLVGSIVCYMQFRRIGETSNNWTSNALVKTGPYGLSRNPMYILDLVLQSGLSMLLGTWWGIVAVVPTWLMYHYWLVLPEESYLERKLGVEYTEYKNSVRRWI